MSKQQMFESRLGHGKPPALVLMIIIIAVLPLALIMAHFAIPGRAGADDPPRLTVIPVADPPTPIPTAIASACAVKPLGLTVDEDLASLELRNLGATLTIHALTLAWPVANGPLTSVRLNDLILWEGRAIGGSTTIFPALTEVLPQIEAGGRATLAFGFATDAARAEYTVIIHFGNGCYAFFSTQSDEVNCDLEQVRSVARDRTVEFGIHNKGVTDTQPVRLVLRWPENQVLTTVQWQGKELWKGRNAKSPFPVESDALTPIGAGQTASLVLEFEADHPAKGPYEAVLTTNLGCKARFVVDDDACSMTIDSFEVQDQRATLTLRNSDRRAAHPRLMALFWPDDKATIRRIEFGDLRFAPPNAYNVSPVILSLAGAAEIAPARNVRLDLLFDGPAPAQGYAIAVQFDRCLSVFSNVQPPLQCPIRKRGDLQISPGAVSLWMSNESDRQIPLDEVWFSFPAQSDGPLTAVMLGEQLLWEGAVTNSPVTFTAGVNLAPAVFRPQETTHLSFLFQNAEIAPTHYLLEIGLPNECRVTATTRSQAPGPCQIEVADEPFRTEGWDVLLSLHNAGPVAAELQALTVTWDADQNGALTAVTLANTQIWSGTETAGTATITPNEDASVPLIEPGDTVDLRLTFENIVVLHPYTFNVNFVEGCNLSYATEAGAPAPRPIEVQGTIEDLPTPVYGSTWQIKAPGGTVLPLYVSQRTVIGPPELLPPQVGDRVTATVIPRADGSLLAIRVVIEPRIAQPVEFTGLIEEVGEERPIEWMVVQGIRVLIGPDTDINQEPVAGWIAEVRGSRGPDGSVRATRVRIFNPDNLARQVEFPGIVEDWEPLSDVESLWTVSGIGVTVHRFDTIHHGIEPGQPPELGTEVLVRGSQQSDHSVYASEIWYGAGDEDIVEFRGVIEALPEDLQHGIWVINSQEVLVTDQTFIDISDGLPAIGVPCEVRARVNPNGSLEALRIRILSDED